MMYNDKASRSNTPVDVVVGALIIIDESKYISRISLQENGYVIDVGIPWYILQYEPYPGFLFFFDVQIWDYDAGRDNHIVLAWQNANKAWYDITAYACVELA